MSNNRVIIWEKWVDPYGQDLDEVEWPGYDSHNITQSNHEESNVDEEPIVQTHSHRINAISTSMGIIPFNEYTDCTKIFNFWLGHTNFNISQKIAELLQSIEGVETLDIFTRYRFRISFGKAFEDRKIMDLINNIVQDHGEEKHEPNT